MITQTFAIFLDAYREVSSKKLFWITLVLSGLVVAAFAAVGLNERGFTILHWTLEGEFNSGMMAPAEFYKQLFINLGIGFWLTWAAMILALISTGGMIPELISSGSIDLMLSKPIGRWRLFLTKYVAGITFVALQVLVFSGASFLVIGIRGGAWEPRLFLAVPIVVAVFSYLFCVCALLGLLTRSGVAAILLTLLLWFLVFGVNAADGNFVKIRLISQINAERTQRLVERETERASRIYRQQNAGADTPPGPPTDEQLEAISPKLRQAREALPERQASAERWTRWSNLIVGVKTLLPKTQETVGLLDRWLLPGGTIDERRERFERRFGFAGNDDERMLSFTSPPDAELAARIEEATKNRSLVWILATSFAFEGVILLICCWIFSRRDF